MSNFPISLDDDVSLPIVTDNLTEIGGDAINALRDSVFNIEQYVGTNPTGKSIESRLSLLVDQNGNIQSSVFTSLGLVTLPITNGQIIDNAGIPESKLRLDYRTQDLFNFIRDLSRQVDSANHWISVSGVKLEPHLAGQIYRHTLSQIDVATTSSQFLDNKFRQLRDNTNSYTLVSDINNELLSHQWADGSPFGIIHNITTNNGSLYPSNYGHTASSIFLNTSRFFTIPQTNTDLQQFADYIDGASIFLLGTRIQNLYTNGISKVSRSASLVIDGYGQAIVPVTPAIAFLNNDGTSTAPVDDIAVGDDIVQFQPSSAALSSNLFVAQFAAVKIGDIVRVNYGTIEVAWVIKEKKYIQTSNTFIVRIAGKNIAYAPNATARIDRALFNNNKFGVLAAAPVPTTGISGASPSLIVATPRGAQALGIGFNPDQFDSSHYLLYLALFPTGNPQDGYTILPAIDVTGNQGATPGSYTLDSIVNATNLAFRQPGFNYRFIAFQFQGNFGVMLADSYNNASFSIINGTIIQSGSSAGNFDPVGTAVSFHNNVVGLFPNNLPGTFNVTNGLNSVIASLSQTGIIPPSSSIIFNSQPGFVYTVNTVSGTAITLTTPYGGTSSGSTTAYLANSAVPLDPLGFGPFGANIASPPFMTSYGSAAAAQNPTKLFVPLKRNNYYVNGVELERMSLDIGQALDPFGDGYWIGTIQNISAGASNLSVTYRVLLDLSASRLKIGKTLVVQSLGQGALVNFGRFVISNIDFEDDPPTPFTDITVYDAVHANGVSPSSNTLPIGSRVSLYFNSDSVSFNKENASDFSSISPHPSFKRHFEVFVDDTTNTFTNERGRFNISGVNPLIVNNVPLWNDPTLAAINIVSISPKLRGYQFGFVTKITLNVTSLNSTAGIFSGYLCSWDGVIGHPFTNLGPVTNGKLGEIIRFYDETNIDYIDFIFDISTTVSSFASPRQLDIQLFPSLSLDDEEMLLSTHQVNDNTGAVDHIVDRRQFGNTSEKDLSTSALNLIFSSPRLLSANGVVRGFDLETTITPNPNNNQIYMTGGLVLVNGNFIQINNQPVSIPIVQETYLSTLYNINWVLCVNQQGEYQPIPLLDFDPVLGTPNNPQRVVSLFNVLNNQTYAVDASTFSDIINNRKDLTPLYFVASTVTVPSGLNPATISLAMQDIRRFINDQDSNIVPAVTTANSQGNFRTFNSALRWLEFNNTFQNTIQVKGSSTVASDLGLLNNDYDIVGQSVNASLTFSSAMNISNVQFTGLSLTFNSNLTTTGVTFNDCNITVSGSLVATNTNFNNGCSISVGSITTNHVKVDSCSSLTVSGSATINTSTIVNMIGGLVTLSGTASLSLVTIDNAPVSFGGATTFNAVKIRNTAVLVGSTITYSSSNTASDIYNCAVQVSVAQGFALASNINFRKCSFLYTANPVGPGYNTTDLVNAGSGMMYANVATTLTNVKVQDCIFNNTLADHFPFVSVQATTYSAVVSDFVVTGNEFASFVSGANDLRAAIAFTSTLTTAAAASVYPKLPKLVNVVIDNNTCNGDQLLLISIIRASGIGAPIIGAPLCVSGTSISGNTCGTIGFFIGPADSANFADGVRDKREQLVIGRNTCKLITNLDARGGYIAFRPISFPANTIDWVQIGTGSYTIVNNTANWIQVGSSSYTAPNGGGTMIGNQVSPNNPLYLNNYIDTINSGLAPGNVGILLRAEFNGTSGTNSVISENIIAQKVFFNADGTTTSGTYYYDCGLACMNNAQVIGNTVSGVINSSTASIMFLDERIIATVTNNSLVRGGLAVKAYVEASSTNNFNAVTITNNFFDSSFIDVANTNETVGLNIPTGWSFFGNRNQIGYEAIYKTPYISDYIKTPFSKDSQEINKYGNFGTAGEALNINYVIAFAQPSGNPVFSVTFGSTNVFCSGFSVPGTFSDINGLLVQFNDSGDFYQVETAAGSGSNVTSFQLFSNGSAVLYAGDTDGGAAPKFYRTGGSPLLTVVNTPTNPVGAIAVRVDVNEILPPNVQILSMVVGVYCNFGSAAIAGGQVIIEASTSQSAQYSLSSLSGTMADVRTSSDATSYPGQISNSFTIGSGAGQVTPTQLANATQYVSLDTSTLTNYITCKNKIISVGYILFINITVPGPTVIVDSPLIIRYRW